MATRNDITVDYQLSPRIAVLADPAATLSLQDYVDTLRVAESSFQGMSFPFLLSASGKEDLGDGVTVAITVQEQNLQLAFEARRTPTVDEGSVTTGSGAPNLKGRYTFVDTGANFVTAGVEPGALVINWTDRSMGDVIEVIDANTIRMEALVNGTDNEMQVADVYSIFNVEQVRVSAGNLTAIDDVEAALNAIRPSAFTQVIVAQASSATLLSSGGLTQGDIDNITDSVWDEALSGHVAAGSAGKALGDIDTNVANLPDAVWDEPADDHLTAGTTGLRLREIKDDTNILLADVATNTALISGLNDITAGDVWDEPIAGHLTAGSTGEALSDASAAAPTAAQIADAVWDEPIDDHQTAGSVGEWLKSKVLTVAKFLGLS
jgi:hypothetical protein